MNDLSSSMALSRIDEAVMGHLSEAEAHADDGPVQDFVQGEIVGAEALAVVHTDGAEADQGGDVVAGVLPGVTVGRDCLPGELAATDTEAADVAADHDVLPRRKVMLQA